MTGQKLLKKQAGRILIFFSLVCLFYLPHPVFGLSTACLSFFQSAGTTDWELNINDFSISTVIDDTVFRLRIQQQRHLRFTAHHTRDKKEVSFGPLHPQYSEPLSRLLDHALCFIEQPKDTGFSMDMAFDLYPESIQRWAVSWQASELNKNWNLMDPHVRYARLTSMMSEFFQKEIHPFAGKLGFEVTGASMEKMTYPAANQIKDYEIVLKPTKIPPTAMIPIPLMVYISVHPIPSAPLPPETPALLFSVDTLFAVAQKNKTSVFVSFNRALNEYEITGSRIETDGTVTPIIPVNRDGYLPVIDQLFKACLAVTGGDETRMFSLRIHPESIPDSGFGERFNPFLRKIGYEFKEFHIGTTTPAIVYLIATKIH